MQQLTQSLCFLALTGMIACGNPTSKKGIDPEALDSVQAQHNKELAAATAKRNTLRAGELIALAGCKDLNCIEQYMKNLSPDFIYLRKGEWAAQQRITIADTSGNELTLPASTFYVDTNPQASWRAAHTVHTKEQGERLLDEFKSFGFQLAGEGYYLGLKSKQQQYISGKYPGISLYLTATFRPWGLKGLYENNVTWPCYVFEAYEDQ
ncbi:hypothetical protein [Niabella aurantiaca]|uniref:hypothetical protein n=1 Tax=Niabella aurantiaca TaxID=379900 RepID=UPI0003808781|nr:hypothetical protein [Niabella aurantiaca]